MSVTRAAKYLAPVDIGQCITCHHTPETETS